MFPRCRGAASSLIVPGSYIIKIGGEVSGGQSGRINETANRDLLCQTLYASFFFFTK